jgi:ceramide glucosyltransferase
MMMGDLLSADFLLVVSLTLGCALFLTHLVSFFLSVSGLRQGRNALIHRKPLAPVTIMRPLCGLEAYSEDTLRSTFHVRGNNIQIIFCVATAADPVVPLVKRLILEFPSANARLLIGDERISANPKLNNLVKAWACLATDWVVWIDSNVNLTSDALARMFSAYDKKAGMVCSPPIGTSAQNIWAELEAVFLNGYQARWQLTAARLGFGFAQGKVMFFHRSLLDDAGGLQALASEPAEDAAASKLIHAKGQSVRLVAKPFGQPLGRRTLVQPWQRQLRWAKLRRATFLYLFLPEILTGGLLPTGLLAFGLHGLDLVPLMTGPLTLACIVAVCLIIWYALELILCRLAGWNVSWKTLPLSVLRDAMIPFVWMSALSSDTFEWQGHVMRVDDNVRRADDHARRADDNVMRADDHELNDTNRSV